MSKLWQRFTERAKRVIIAAQDATLASGHRCVTPEYLLIGLISEREYVAARVLERLDVDLDSLKQEIRHQVGVQDHPVTGGGATLEPRTRKVLDNAYDEAKQSGSDYIGTEHLLLGILREGKGIAFEILVYLGVDLNRVRQEVARCLEEARRAPEAAGPGRRQYTYRARQVIIRAHDAAAAEGDPSVSPEHLLIGLIREGDSIGLKVLERLGVKTRRLLWDVESQVAGQPGASHAGEDSVPNQRLKRVLLFAYDEARQMNSGYLGSEHLVLGILREGDGIACRILAKHGVDIIAARGEVRSYLGIDPAAASPISVLEPAVRVGKFRDPLEAEVWLNSVREQGYWISFQGASAGMIWVVMESDLDTINY